MMATRNQQPHFHMSANDFQVDLVHDFSMDQSEVGQPAVSWIFLAFPEDRGSICHSPVIEQLFQFPRPSKDDTVWLFSCQDLSAPSDASHLVPWTLHRSRLQERPHLSLFHYWLFLSSPNPVHRYKDLINHGEEESEYLSLICISGN